MGESQTEEALWALPVLRIPEAGCMKVALYARVSKADDSQDPENQLMRLRSYAKMRSWDVYDEYVDRASGADDYRPALDRMMNDAAARRVGLVLTTKIDRIARSAGTC